MKKILIITDTWSPQINGVVTALERTVDYLKKNNFEVVVIHPGLFYSVSLFFYPEIKVSVFARKKIERIINKEKPDYIHIATEGTLGLAARTVCVYKNFLFTTSYHTHFPLYLKLRTGFLFHTTYTYLQWFHSASSAVMVSTPSLKSDLESHNFKNIVICPLGVDTDLFQVNLQKSGQSSIYKSPVFVFLGRVAIEKNIEEFLKCELPGTKLVIGDGPQKNDLQEKYPDCVFVGYKKGQELVDVLSICDVLVFPSLTDTFGLVALEALACGLPVAAHNVMGPRDIITHGVDGFLSDDLSVAAQECLQLSKEKCREKSLLFSWEESGKCFVKNLICCGSK